MSRNAPASTAAGNAAVALWNTFCSDPRSHFFHLEDAVERDAALDISAVAKPVDMQLSHPGDQLAMAAVPMQMTVHFMSLPVQPYQVDKRDILILPSQEEFLGWHGLLPCIEVTRSDDATTACTIWQVSAPGAGSMVHFMFAQGAAPLAQATLGSLAKAAAMRREALAQMLVELHGQVDLGSWNSVRRTVASNFWKDLPQRIRHRVVAYFCGDARAAASVSRCDIGALIRDGGRGHQAVLAGEILLAGLSYWQWRGAARLVTEPFWDVEMGRAAPFNVSAADFCHALRDTLDAYDAWVPLRQFYRDVLHEMDRCMSMADSDYRLQRTRLLRALMRGGGQRVSKAGAVWRDPLDGVEPAQVRQRLSHARRLLPPSLAQGGALEFTARLARISARIVAPRAVLIEAGMVVDADSMARDCMEGDNGCMVLCYALSPDLPPAAVAAVFDLPSTPLANGDVPMEVLCAPDGSVDGDSGTEEGWCRWCRLYRFHVAPRFDSLSGTWHGMDREVSVQGVVPAQRDALDAHMAALMARIARCQQLHLRRHDMPLIHVGRYDDVVLSPRSRWGERRLVLGGGGRLVLPAALCGTVLIDCTARQQTLPAPQLVLAPGLADGLRPAPPVTRGQRSFDVWQADGCTLLVAHGIGTCGAGIAAQADAAARRRLRDDLCNPALPQVVVGPAVAGEIELGAIVRDLALQACAGPQQFVLRRLDGAAICLRVAAGTGPPTPLALTLDLHHDKLPRYSMSTLSRQTGAGLAGWVADGVTGGCLRLELAPEVTLDSSAWHAACRRCEATLEQALADVLAWDQCLAEGQLFDAGQLREIGLYGAQFSALGQRAWQGKAAILCRQWCHEWQLPAGAIDCAEQAAARDMMAQVVVYLFRAAIAELSDEQWARRLREGVWCRERLPLQRVLGLVADRAWDHGGGAHGYAVLVAFARCQAMLASPSGQTRALRTADALAAIVAAAGHPAYAPAMPTARRLQCKMLLTAHLDALLFDDDAHWRDTLMADLWPSPGQLRQVSRAALLAALLSAGGAHHATMLTHQRKRALVPAHELLVFADAGLSATGRGGDSVLLFIGQLETACDGWHWGAHRISMAFQWIDGLGWTLCAGAPGEARTVACDAAAWNSNGPGLNYLMGAALLALQEMPAEDRCIARMRRCLLDGDGQWRRGLGLLRLTDLAGNSYLLLGNAATRLAQRQPSPGVSSSPWQAGGAMPRVTVRAQLAAMGGALAAMSIPGRKLALLSPRERDAVVAGADDDSGRCAVLARRLRSALHRRQSDTP